MSLLGSSATNVERIARRIRNNLPLTVRGVVTAHDCPDCGCSGTCDWREDGEPDPDAVTCKTCQCQWCGPMKPHVAACGECGGTRGHRDDCAVVAKAERRQREAPLLALVAAVPEGLNPIGWRAAVLATSERFARIPEDDRPHPEDWGPRLATMVRARIGGADEGHALVAAKAMNGTAMAVALLCGSRGYMRAIAPHKAPPPERKRGPRLPIDDGGHYE